MSAQKKGMDKFPSSPTLFESIWFLGCVCLGFRSLFFLFKSQRIKVLALSLAPFISRYEEEVALRATAENEFVALKKVSDPRICVPQLRKQGRGREEPSVIQRG